MTTAYPWVKHCLFLLGLCGLLSGCHSTFPPAAGATVAPSPIGPVQSGGISAPITAFPAGQAIVTLPDSLVYPDDLRLDFAHAAQAILNRRELTGLAPELIQSVITQVAENRGLRLLTFRPVSSEAWIAKFTLRDSSGGLINYEVRREGRQFEVKTTNDQ